MILIISKPDYSHTNLIFVYFGVGLEDFMAGLGFGNSLSETPFNIGISMLNL